MLEKPACVERRADGGDAAVHHVGGRDDVGSGAGVGDGTGGEPFERGVVVDVAVDDLAAVAVAGVLAVADVGDDDEFGVGGFDGADGLLDDAVVVVRAGGLLVLVLGDAEEDDAADAEGDALGAFLDEFVDGELEIAGHGVDRLADAFALDGEQGEDEVVGGEIGFADETADTLGAAQAAGPVNGKRHKLIVAHHWWMGGNWLRLRGRTALTSRDAG